MITVGGVSAAVSKTAAAPIERVKLLIQNQVRSHISIFISLPYNLDLPATRIRTCRSIKLIKYLHSMNPALGFDSRLASLIFGNVLFDVG